MIKINVTNTFVPRDLLKLGHRGQSEEANGSTGIAQDAPVDMPAPASAKPDQSRAIHYASSGFVINIPAEELPIDSRNHFNGRSVLPESTLAPKHEVRPPEHSEPTELGYSNWDDDHARAYDLTHERLVQSSLETRDSAIEHADGVREEIAHFRAEEAAKPKPGPDYEAIDVAKRERQTVGLEQFLTRIHKEARINNERSDDARYRDMAIEENLENHSIKVRDESVKTAGELRVEASAELKQRWEVRQETDAINRHEVKQGHEAQATELKIRSDMFNERVDKLYRYIHETESKVLEARQFNIVPPARTVYEPPEEATVDHEQYVAQLKLALIPEQPQDDDTIAAGESILESLQSEGVFGITSAGRYQSVNDFVKSKSFEYELEQRKFTEDEFLRETETAIYDVLNGGNSTSVTKMLLQAAESVNSFRNLRVQAYAQSGSQQVDDKANANKKSVESQQKPDAITRESIEAAKAI